MRQLNKRDAWQLAVAGVALGKRLHHRRRGGICCAFHSLSAISAVTTTHKDKNSPKKTPNVSVRDDELHARLNPPCAVPSIFLAFLPFIGL